MSWTDERVEILKRLWGEGHSASQIAKELGGVTRNAVIGKVHRLGLSNRAAPGAEATASAADPAPSPEATPETTPAESTNGAAPADNPVDNKATPPASNAERPLPPRAQIVPAGRPLPPQPSANEISPEALARVSEVEKVARKLSLMELTEKTCKWPVGDPATSNFWFCGLPVQAGKPYCEAHVGVAFQPMSARRDRRR